MNLRIRRSALALALASILVSLPASAETLEAALQRAVTAFNAGKFRDAAAALGTLAERTGDTKTRAAVLKFLVAAEWATRKRDRTDDLIRRALTLDPELDLDPAGFPLPLVERFNGIRSNLRGKLVVTCIPDGGEVEVVGRALDRCGVEIELPIGRHAVRVKWGQTQLPNALTVVVPVAQTVAAVAKAPPPPITTPTVTTPSDASIKKPVVGPTPPEPTPPKSYKTLGWTLVGSGLAASVAGTVLQIVAHNTALIPRFTESSPNYADAQSLAAKMQREDVVGAILIGMGAASIAGGAITLLIDQKRANRWHREASRFTIGMIHDMSGTPVPSLTRAWSF